MHWWEKVDVRLREGNNRLTETRFYFAVFALGRTGGLDLDDALLSVGKLSERGSVVI